MKNQTKSFSIRLEEQLLEQMDEHKEKNGINWSAKIRNFIKAEIAQQNSIVVKPKEKIKPKKISEPVVQEQDIEEPEDDEDDKIYKANTLKYIATIDEELAQIQKRFRMSIKRKVDVIRADELQYLREAAFGSLSI